MGPKFLNLTLFIIDIPLCYYINFRASITFYLFSREFVYFFSISLSSAIFLELFCDDVLETFTILSVILLPIKSSVASPVF